MLSNKNKFSRYALLAMTMLFGLLALHDRATQHYAYISLTNPNQVQIDFLWEADISALACKRRLDVLDEVALADCPKCQIRIQSCLTSLNPNQIRMLNHDALDFPAAYLRNAVISYQSSNPKLAMQACQENQVFLNNNINQFICTPEQSIRSTKQSDKHVFWANLIEIFLLLVTSGLASWFVCYLILRYEHLHQHFSHDHINSGIQKLHVQSTARIGGIAFLMSLLVSLAIELCLHSNVSSNSLGLTYFILAIAPVFFGGIIEDVTKKVGVTQRLLFSIASALIAIWLLGGYINRTDIATLDALLGWAPVALIFTTLVIAGICNASNIIDGYNGLAGGYAAIALAAIACVAFKLEDHLILILSIGLMGGVLGFLCWNWPNGKLFMGDGGAYLLGFSLAELAILLIYRHPVVSPWFTVLILAYPIIETLFSMFRRKFIHKTNASDPDKSHYHQLVYFKILKAKRYSEANQINKANSRVALFVWIPASLIAVLGTLFWQSTAILMPLTLGGSMTYLLIYWYLHSLPD